MTSDWNAFLSRQGAITDNWGTTHFSNQPSAPRRAEENWLCDLGYQGLLALTGPDAGKFLQGQVTCDVRDLDGQRSLLGAQCDLKGRVLASFRALQSDSEQILLRLHRGLLEETRATLGKYLVFSKAKLEDVSAQWRHIGLAGPAAAELLLRHLGALPEQPGHWCEAAGNRILMLDTHRYECWIAPEQAQALWQALSEHCTPGGSNAWTLLDIRAGIAEVRPETRGLFTPQELNYQLVEAISFRKGCYTGQEVVARLHYKARLKSALYRFALPQQPDELPGLGGEVPSVGDHPGIGLLVMAAPDAEGDLEALIVARHTTANADWLNRTGAKPQRLPLPYAIPVPQDAPSE